MSRKGLVISDVKKAIDILISRGEKVTNRGIRSITKTGSLSTIARLRNELSGDVFSRSEIDDIKDFVSSEILKIKNESEHEVKIKNTLLWELSNVIYLNESLPEPERKSNISIADDYGINRRDVGVVKRLLLQNTD